MLKDEIKKKIVKKRLKKLPELIDQNRDLDHETRITSYNAN